MLLKQNIIVDTHSVNDSRNALLIFVIHDFITFLLVLRLLRYFIKSVCFSPRIRRVINYREINEIRLCNVNFVIRLNPTAV